MKRQFLAAMLVASVSFAMPSEPIAGMAGVSATLTDDDTMYSAFAPTLAEFAGPAPTAFSFVSSQVGNTNAISKLPMRRADEIKDGNILGAAFTDDAIVHCPPSGRYYNKWSPWWVIADDDMRSKASCPAFSTHMLPTTATNVSLTVRLPKPTPLAKLRLTPRTRSTEPLGFPYDFHVEVSVDGARFKTIHSVRDFNVDGTIPEISLDSSPVAAIRVTADRIRPEGNGFGYFQLSRMEALDKEGVNHALISKGAVAETSEPMNVPVLDRASFLDGAIVDCGVKTVLVHVNILGGSSDASVNGGFAIGTPAFDNLTDNIRYLKSRGVKTYVRLLWGNSVLAAKTPEERAEFIRNYIVRITPFVKAWKGLVACYPIGNEENQYRNIGKGEKFDVKFYRETYREAVFAASKAIHAIDPQARTAVTSALFDFGWTEDVLASGLAGELDEVSVHIYRETDPLGSYPEKCYSFFVDGRRGLESERRFTRAEDEIRAFRALLDRYNPKLRFASHEMSMRIGPCPKGMNSTEAGQAKFALRTYVMHHFYGISPSIWWSFNSGKISRKETGDIEWGVMCSGEKRQAWYAMRNFAALFDESWKPESEMSVLFEPADERFYSYSFKRGSRRLVACWTAVSMRDGNTGKLADVFVSGDFGGNTPKVSCVDLFNGGVQKLNVENAEGGFRVRGLVMRDYPLVLCYSQPVIDGNAEHDAFRQ